MGNIQLQNKAILITGAFGISFVSVGLREKMLETELCPSRVFSPFREESGDEELSVLPRHTKVIVTGNNRTKSVLVGLQGVVKKAVGLGGWHWLVFADYFNWFSLLIINICLSSVSYNK